MQLFSADALRYPILLLLGESYSGKTEFAKSLFSNPLELKVGGLSQFPDGLRDFKRGVHDAIVLDDLRDLRFLTENQDKIQGKYDGLIEFATTAGGACKYELYLFKVPIVATANFSTKNLDLLDSHDWLRRSSNCRVVVWKSPWSS